MNCDLFLKIAPIVISLLAFILSLIVLFIDMKMKIAKVKLTAFHIVRSDDHYLKLTVVNRSWNPISILKCKVFINRKEYVIPRKIHIDNLPLNLPTFYSGEILFPLSNAVENKIGSDQETVIHLYTSRGLFRGAGNFRPVNEMTFKMKRLKEKENF